MSLISTEPPPAVTVKSSTPIRLETATCSVRAVAITLPSVFRLVATNNWGGLSTETFRVLPKLRRMPFPPTPLAAAKLEAKAKLPKRTEAPANSESPLVSADNISLSKKSTVSAGPLPGIAMTGASGPATLNAASSRRAAVTSVFNKRAMSS